MAELSEATRWTLLFCIFSKIYGEPTCNHGIGATGPNVVCAAGTGHYVLRKGLVSDNDRTTAIALKGCHITKIQEDALNALPALEEIDLSYNSIKALTGLFNQTPSLRKLNISDNRIEDLKLTVFDPLTKLNSLDLSNNAILGRNLDTRIFQRSQNIDYLDFSGNYMSGTQENFLQSLNAIKTLKLSSCALKEVPTFATRPNLNTMIHLTLSSNEITRLHDSKMFINLVKLESIKLGGNLIDFIQEDVFKPLKNIKTISLEHNNLKDLSQNVFQRLPKLGNIKLCCSQIMLRNRQ